MRVMIVDDSEGTRIMLERVLRMAEPNLEQCYHAASGEDALQKLTSAVVDVVFTDLNMDGMDGRELIQAIRKNQLWKPVSIAVVTSERSEATERELKALGANCYLIKPVTSRRVTELFSAVREGRS